MQKPHIIMCIAWQSFFPRFFFVFWLTFNQKISADAWKKQEKQTNGHVRCADDQVH